MASDTQGLSDSANHANETSPEPELRGVQAQEPNISNMSPSQEGRETDSSSDQGGTGRARLCGTCLHEAKGRFTKVDAIFVLVGMVLYIADLVTDLLVGVQYFRQGDILWSIMTFVFVFVPSLVLQYFSFRWFILDLDKDEKYKSKTPFEKLWAWCQWLASHVLQLGAIKRYWSTLNFGMLSRKDSKYYPRMIVERLDITMLRLLEAFLESAPQLVLQVYIMVEIEELYWLTAASFVSLFSLAFSLGIYQKALRDYLPNKDELSYSGVVLIIVWRLFTITARVIAMALFASIYEWWVFVLAAAHWAIMTGWLLWQDTAFHESRYDEIPFDAVIGIIHIFCFFNMKEGPTRYRAIIFYVIIFIENTIMLGLWYSEQESQEQTYGLPALVFVWGGFFIGISLMSFYYNSCHPTGKKIPIFLCGDTSSNDPMTQSSAPCATGEEGHDRDETDDGVEIDVVNVESTDSRAESTTSTRKLSERDRYRYLSSYKWRRRIHPKVLQTEKNSNNVDSRETVSSLPTTNNNIPVGS